MNPQISLQASQTPLPNRFAPVGAQLPSSLASADTLRPCATGSQTSDRGQGLADALWTLAPVGHNFPGGLIGVDAPERLAPGDQTTNAGLAVSDDLMGGACVGSDSETGGAVPRTLPATYSPRPSLFDPSLYTMAQYLDDIEGLRIAQGSRLRILTQKEPDKDGIMRGFGYDDDHPVVAIVRAQFEHLKELEHSATLELQRLMRKHPLNEWRKRRKGVGEKQLARLLSVIGDPYIRQDTGQPRTVSQLWAYMGLNTLPGKDGSDFAPKLQKGVKANWSVIGKARAYLIALSCIKQAESPYRKVYDERRAHTDVTRPDWKPIRSHNDAIRITSKRILRDLWRAARDYHHGKEVEG